MEKVDILVVGAGAVGLAVATKLAAHGREVVVCEKEMLPGKGISARNSGVIHAGIYYPQDSFKAKLCVEGKKQLYDFCRNYRVPFQQLGKLIVATSYEEQQALLAVQEKAAANGVTDLALLSRAEVLELEPALDVTGGLFSPSTGIIDVPAYITALAGAVEQSGGVIACHNAVVAIEQTTGGFMIHTSGSAEAFVAQCVINCAGLGAQHIAYIIKGLSSACIPPLYKVQGTYFALSGAAPFRHLVYPIPVKGGLGIHATLDISGAVRFGPDVQPVMSEDYAPDARRETAFRDAISRYYPAIANRVLTQDYVGIRPQIAKLGTFADFMISGPNQHGLKGLVNLFGVESPGLTASLAIADHVVKMA
ncbi:NAD(P)/FAD-dependent oxidoreductase [Kordiimonas pumila]|uniref:NAD(P)/FAD-dependent oxidoreductase n=1 Tax=Kordiimonas pumila TaxID=2161677 RepID=A0ABV7D9S8_9PROT|nr:NAD(P)/FAD-dependent oxidoreductase [Kordiimonas pumila]